MRLISVQGTIQSLNRVVAPLINGQNVRFLSLIVVSTTHKFLAILSYAVSISLLLWGFSHYMAPGLFGRLDFISSYTDDIFVPCLFALVVFFSSFIAVRLKSLLVLSLAREFISNNKRDFFEKKFSLDFVTSKIPVIYSSIANLFSSFIFLVSMGGLILFISYWMAGFVIFLLATSFWIFSIIRRKNFENRKNTKFIVERWQANFDAQNPSRFDGKNFDNVASSKLALWKAQFEIVHLEGMAISIGLIILVASIILSDVPALSGVWLLVVALGIRFIFGSCREFSQALNFLLRECGELRELSTQSR